MADTLPRVPHPLYPTVEIRLRSNNALVSAPNVQIRALSPTGQEYLIPATEVSTGIYRATDLFVCDVRGRWVFEGHSPVIGDLIKSDEVALEVHPSSFTQTGTPANTVYPGSIGVQSLSLLLVVQAADILAGFITTSLPWVPRAVFAQLDRGSSFSDQASIDGVTASVTVAVTDPAISAGSKIMVVVFR